MSTTEPRPDEEPEPEEEHPQHPYEPEHPDPGHEDPGSGKETTDATDLGHQHDEPIPPAS